MTREDWLNRAATTLIPVVVDKGEGRTIDKVYISVGWPSVRGLSKKRRRVGECWSAKTSKDGLTPHIFISPLLDDTIDVLGTLVHELVHALGIYNHKGEFRSVAVAVGLTGRMTATVPGEELRGLLEGIGQGLGEYPHSGINPADGERPVKKQGTRLLKAVCDNEECGTIIRVTRKVVEYPGLPICRCGGSFEEG